MANNPLRFAYFGNSRLSVIVLEALLKKGFLPTVVITTPDQPQGRKKVLTPTPTKVFAHMHGVPVIEATSVKKPEFENTLKSFEPLDVSIVTSYGKLIPERILHIPKRGTLNVHPSILPAFRGPAPIQAQILNNVNPVGVSIMELDAEMDHGPILGMKSWTHEELKAFNINWPTDYETLETFLGSEGGDLLAELLPKWVLGEIPAISQDHAVATYTQMIQKAQGEISLTDDGLQNFLKFQAYKEWPGTYFFAENAQKRARVIIKDATYENGVFVIKSVVPEGSKEMSFADWERGFKA